MWQDNKTLNCGVCGAASNVACNVVGATCWLCKTLLDDTVTDGDPKDVVTQHQTDKPIISMEVQKKQSAEGRSNPTRSNLRKLEGILKNPRMRLRTRTKIAEMREMKLVQMEIVKHLIVQQEAIKCLMLTNEGMKTTIEKMQQQLKQYLGIR